MESVLERLGSEPWVRGRLIVSDEGRVVCDARQGGAPQVSTADPHEEIPMAAESSFLPPSKSGHATPCSRPGDHLARTVREENAPAVAGEV